MAVWLFGVVALLVLAVQGDEECVLEPGTSCRCRTSSGHLQLDISSLFSYPAHPTPKDPSAYNYTYNPCSDTDCASPPAAVCQYVISQKREVGIGRTSNITWTVVKEKPLTFTILYEDGDKDKDKPARSALFLYQWSNSDMRAVFENEDQEAQEYFFNVTGNRIVAVAGSSGGGGIAVGVVGVVILSLAVAGVVAYLVIGCVYMYQVKGARGVEVIPNYTFWRELPYLIWDGCLFIISPCYTKKETYQRL